MLEPQRFLCNTSGSGKTRLLLQGLCRNWGLYFTARNVGGIGSADLEEVSKLFLGTLQPITSENGLAALRSNISIASRHFSALLYARVSILHIFLNIASTNNITENLQERWMFLQVAPAALVNEDFFAQRTRMLGHHSDFTAEIEKEIIFIQQYLMHLNSDQAKLFCVVDEAQVLTAGERAFVECFCASDVKGMPILDGPRPILRQLVSNWEAPLHNMVISGTGVSMKDIEIVLGSLVAKEAGRTSETITEVGAFNDDDSHRVYMESYLPTKFLDTPSGKELVSRVGYWLHGR